MRRKGLLALALLLTLGLGTFSSGPGFAQTPHGGLVPDGDAPDLFLLYSGDVIGFIDPCG